MLDLHLCFSAALRTSCTETAEPTISAAPTISWRAEFRTRNVYEYVYCTENSEIDPCRIYNQSITLLMCFSVVIHENSVKCLAPH